MRTIYAASTAWTGPRPGSEALQVWAPSGPPPKRTGRLQNLQRHSWLKGAAGTGDIGDIKTSATFDCLRTEPDHLRWPCYRSWAASQVYCKHWPTMSKCCIKSRDFAPPKCLAQASPLASPLASLQPWKMTIAFFLVNSGLVQAPKHPRAGSRHRKASETCACFKICAERKACGSLGFSWMTWQEKDRKGVEIRCSSSIQFADRNKLLILCYDAVHDVRTSRIASAITSSTWCSAKYLRTCSVLHLVAQTRPNHRLRMVTECILCSN